MVYLLNLPNMNDNNERKRHPFTTKYELLNATKPQMFVSGELRLNEQYLNSRNEKNS